MRKQMYSGLHKCWLKTPFYYILEGNLHTRVATIYKFELVSYAFLVYQTIFQGLNVNYKEITRFSP